MMKALIHILGSGRSGTTMLDLILGNDGNAFSCGEVNAWYYPWRRSHFEINCVCGQNPCPVWENIKHFSEKRFHLLAAQKLKVDYIVDSSKELIWTIDNNIRYRKVDIEVFNVLIYKDPLDFAYSHYKRGENLARSKSDFKEYHERLLRSGLPFVTVNYSDLVNDPHAVVVKLCFLTGMEYRRDKVKFWQKKHHHIFGSSGVRRQLEGSSEIRPTSYSSDFLKEKSSIRSLFDSDRAYGKLMVKLKSRDVLKIDKHEFTRQHNNYSLALGPWYYTGKLKRTFWRLFPQPNIFSSGTGRLKKLYYSKDL